MLSVTGLFDAYTVTLALCLRTHFFFQSLLKCSTTPSEILALRKERKKFFKGEFRVSNLLQSFDKKNIEESLKSSVEKCLSYAEERYSKDETLDACSVCLSEKANYYIIHGRTAHKCVCARCAMNISINEDPKCPICRQSITLMAVSAPRVEKCMCSDTGCSSLVLMSVDNSCVLESSKSLVECTTCTLVKEMEKSSSVNVAYDLYK